MSLFSHRTHARLKSSTAPSASSWQSGTGNALHRRTVIPPWFINTASLILMGLLVLLSLSIGVADFSWSGILQSLLTQSANSDSSLLLVSRIPRTIAIILTGIAMAVAGMIIQVVLKKPLCRAVYGWCNSERCTWFASGQFTVPCQCAHCQNGRSNHRCRFWHDAIYAAHSSYSAH
ncbi:iron chelate uptake ABC transporter family permease subunit [Psychrobacter sp. JCM 18900]|uniref:iron chelate uptake ABC transporter family permease subunit n=1 Tax=Psychrobacter sp. JCM 18900 TaxID=1298608 RepID=UPI0021C2AE15